MDSKKIQFRIMYYIVSTAILLALVITSISIIPFYENLQALQTRDLIASRDIAILISNKFINHIRETAIETTNRARAAQALDDYANGKLKYQQLKNIIDADLELMLKKNKFLVSMKRFDHQGKALSISGKTIPISNPILENKISITGPFLHNRYYYILVNTPLLNTTGKVIGIDQMVFNFTPIIGSLTNAQLQNPGGTLLAHYIGTKLEIFFPFESTWNQYVNSTNNILTIAAKKAILTKETGSTTGYLGKNKVTLLYGPVENIPWAVIVIAKNSDLLAPIKNTLLQIIATIIAATIFLILGLIILLKPLSGKLIFHISELTDRVAKAKNKLKIVNKKLKYLTIHDTLTAVANRRGFNLRMREEISRAKRHKHPFTLLYLDINEFKSINDHYGHSVGDQVLVHLSELVKKSLRNEDFVARIGGDEFAAILPETSSGDQIVSVITKLKSLIEKSSIVENGQSVKFSVSIGAAVYPNDGKNSNALLKEADLNMYKDKQGWNLNFYK